MAHPLNHRPGGTIDFLTRRRSVKTRDMGDPGPTDAEMEMILKAATRVPDHGKLAPWRFIVVRGQAAQERLGRAIAEAYEAEETAPQAATAKGLARFAAQAPVLVVAACAPSDRKPIPLWEQELSTGAACMQMLNAAHALGYVGQWLTGWAAYSPGVHDHLGLTGTSRIAGFLFFGTQIAEPEERPRPDLSEVVSLYADD